MKSTFKIAFFLIIIVIYSCNRTSNYQNKSEMVFDQTTGKLTIKAKIRNYNYNYFLLSHYALINSLKIDNKNISIRHIYDTLYLSGIKSRSRISIEYSLPIDSFKVDKIYYFTRPQKWFPFKYDLVSKMEFTIELPKSFTLYSCGRNEIIDKSQKSNTYLHINNSNTSYAIIIAPEDYYSYCSKVVNNKEIDFYFVNKDTLITNSIISESVKTFELCTKTIGEYSRDKLIFIECPDLWYCQSLEGFIIAGEGFVSYYNDPEMKFWPSHEMIHQWIGSGMYIANNNEFKCFIEESLTEYLRLYFIKTRFDNDSLLSIKQSMIGEYNSKIKDSENDVSISTNKPNRVTYIIGPLYFDYLQRTIGDKDWKKFINDLYSSNINKIITYKDFKETLSKYLNIKEIDELEELLKHKGIPNKIVSS